jgi:O-antigen/teichoic acid export membrane protein
MPWSRVGPLEQSMSGEHSPGTRLAARISQHATIYGVAASVGLVSGILAVVVYTRYLDPAEFGRVAVLSTIASMVSLLANTATLQGTMRRVYGASGEEDVGDAEHADEVSADPRLSLTTGLTLTTAVGAALLLVAWAWQDPLADLLVGASRDGDLVVLTVAAGALGAVMRLARNVVRLQRRPLAYLAITAIGTLGSVLIAIPLLERGLAIEGILIGLMVANAAAVVVNLALLRLDIRAAVSAREAVEIVRSGLFYVPIVISFQAIQLADTLLVAHFANFQETGLYRVAQKTATPVTYGTSVFIQSWGPMQRDLVNVAAGMHQGAERLAARVVTHYALFVTAIVLFVAVFADQIVRIAASEYDSAAALVPLVALSISGHGWYVISYRISNARRKRSLFLAMSMVAAVVFVVGCALLIPPLGAAGAPVAGIVAWTLAAVTMVVFGQVYGEPVPFEYGRLLTIALVTAIAWAIGYLLLPDSILGVVGKAGVLGAWFGSLVALRVVPLDELRGFARFVGAAGGEESMRRIGDRVGEQEPAARELLEQVAVNQVPAETVARSSDRSTEQVLAGTVQALRSIVSGAPATELDAAIGELIFGPKTRAEQDLGLGALVAQGLDPIDADQLLRAARAIQGHRRQRD